MKKFFEFVASVLFVVSYFLASAIFGSGQVVVQSASTQSTKTEQQIKQEITRLDGFIDVGVARTRIASQSARPQPGDQPVFLLKSSHEFIRRGETLNLSLVSMVETNRLLNIYGQIQKPNDTTGEYDGSQPIRYFQADNGNYGQVSELQPFREVKLLSRLFTGEDSLGRHTFNIVVVDGTSRLVQQIIVDIYLVNAGTYGRHFYVTSAQPMSYEFLLTGRFPTNTPIYYWVGAQDAGGIMTGPDPRWAPYSDGTSVVVGGAGMGYGRATSLDVMMWAPGSRYAIVKPHVWVQAVPSQ